MRSIILLLFLTIATFNSRGQDIPYGYQKVNGFLVPTELLDPEYPIKQYTGDSNYDEKVFTIELREYTKRLGRLPAYVYTGNLEKDQASYEESIMLFLEKHPYFPQPLDTYNEGRNDDVFECLWKGYFRYFPEKAKRIIILEEGGVK